MDHAESHRPAKRRRVEMPLPDGFSVTKHSKPVSKTSAGHFVSAFDEDLRASNGKPNGIGPVKKSAAAREYELQRTHAGDGPRKINNALPLAKINDIVVPVDKFMKFKTDARLRPVPIPPSVMPTSTSIMRTTSILKVSHKIPNGKPPSKKMAILGLPVALNLNSGPDKPKKESNTRPISSLTLGMLNDGSSENVAEEVTLALLRDKHSDVFASLNSSLEIGHGLDLSPRKKHKSNKPKLARCVYSQIQSFQPLTLISSGGLAARATAYIDRSFTDFLLWRKELQHNPNNLASADFCASIIKILYSPTSFTSPYIALCQIRLPHGTTHPIYKSHELYRLVFTLPSLSGSIVPGSLGQIREGQEIHVFKPWHEVSLSLDEQDKVDPLIPASLQLPLSIPYSTPNPLDAPISSLSILCSRFLVA